MEFEDLINFEFIDKNFEFNFNKINELTHKQKYHLKKKATDPEYLKRKVREMQEYHKKKAHEICFLKIKTSNNLNLTKLYR